MLQDTLQVQRNLIAAKQTAGELTHAMHQHSQKTIQLFPKAMNQTAKAIPVKTSFKRYKHYCPSQMWF